MSSITSINSGLTKNLMMEIAVLFEEKLRPILITMDKVDQRLSNMEAQLSIMDTKLSNMDAKQVAKSDNLKVMPEIYPASSNDYNGSSYSL